MIVILPILCFKLPLNVTEFPRIISLENGESININPVSNIQTDNINDLYTFNTGIIYCDMHNNNVRYIMLKYIIFAAKNRYNVIIWSFTSGYSAIEMNIDSNILRNYFPRNNKQRAESVIKMYETINNGEK